MIRFSHALLIATVAGALASPTTLVAQRLDAPRSAAFEGFVSRATLDNRLGSHRFDGIGARVLWPLASARWFAPATLGASITYAPDDAQDSRSWLAQGEGEWHLLNEPLFGRISPIASLGAGVFHFTRTERVRPSGNCALVAGAFARAAWCIPPSMGSTAMAVTDPALTPGIGARVALLPGLALRGDLRDLIVFRGGPIHNRQLAAGISIGR